MIVNLLPIWIFAFSKAFSRNTLSVCPLWKFPVSPPPPPCLRNSNCKHPPPMPLDSLPCPRNSFQPSMVWYGYFLESPNGQQKHPTCFATLLQNELNSSVHILPPRNQPVLQQIRLMQVAKSCCTKSLHVVHFTDPRQTCFAASS